jgi:hypothetical protein
MKKPSRLFSLSFFYRNRPLILLFLFFLFVFFFCDSPTKMREYFGAIKKRIEAKNNNDPNPPQTSTCSQRSNCEDCSNLGYDSTGSKCYWCSDKSQCINTSTYDKWKDSTCSSDLAKCKKKIN